MKTTQRFNRVVKPLKSVDSYPKDPKPSIVKIKPNLKPKSKTKPRTINQKALTHPGLQSTVKTHVSVGESPNTGPEFYQIDSLDLAPRLLGKYLRRDDVVLQITEVET
ncbi:hypothetical protein L2E82_51116 [Cichorium intybus]|nr:hypothetical protein L2E82_51116 [Cichorium intybus]